MKEHGSALLLLILGVLVLVVLVVSVNFLLPKYTSVPSLNTNGAADNNSESITAPIDQAKSAADQANLKATETALESYFAENGRYPSSLSSLDLSLNTSVYNYQLCGSGGDEAILSESGTAGGVYFNSGTDQQVTSRACY